MIVGWAKLNTHYTDNLFKVVFLATSLVLEVKTRFPPLQLVPFLKASFFQTIKSGRSLGGDRIKGTI